MLELGWKVPATVEGTADGAPVGGDSEDGEDKTEVRDLKKKKISQENQPGLAIFGGQGTGHRD